MKRLSKIVNGILGVVALLAIFAVLIFAINTIPEQKISGLIVTSASPYPAPDSIIGTAPYPGPDATSNLVKPTIFPTVTLAPKPTEVVSTTPTTSAYYQTLSLPPSLFWAIWIENLWENRGGILWAADPVDLSKQREIFGTKFGRITSAAVSSDGQKLAVATSDSIISVLWIMNFDGSDQKQIDQANAIGSLAWGRDNISLAYIANRNSADQSKKNRGEIVLQKLANGEKKVLVEAGSDAVLNILGWSIDGDHVFYSLAEPKEAGYEYQLWAVDSKGENHQQITSLGNEMISPILSPEGGKFLFVTPDGPSLYALSDGKSQKLLGTWLNQGYQVVWGNNDKECIITRFDPKLPIVYIELYNLESGTIKEIGRFEPSPNGYDLRLLGISPDLIWAVVSESAEAYFVHVPSGAKVSFPYNDRQVIFVTWVSKTNK